MQVNITSSITRARLVVLGICVKLMILIITGLKCARNWEHGRKPCVKPSYGLPGIEKRRKILSNGRMDSPRYAEVGLEFSAVRDAR